jgi:hypothetical protein
MVKACTMRDSEVKLIQSFVGKAEGTSLGRTSRIWQINSIKKTYEEVLSSHYNLSTGTNRKGMLDIYMCHEVNKAMQFDRLQ